MAASSNRDSSGQVSRLPHAVPLEQSTFVSSHDSFYQRYRTQSAAPMQPKEKKAIGGHLTNGERPVRPIPFGRNVSTAHATFGKGGDAPVFGGKSITAHVRNQSHIGTGGPSEPMQSTAQGSFGPPGPPPAGQTFRYAGDSAVKYNPNLLRIDEPPPIKKPKKEFPPPPGKIGKSQEGLHILPGVKLEGKPKMPVHSFERLQGGPDMANKKPEPTGALKMGGNVSQVGLFDEVFDGTTTYRHFMVNQWKLPEKPDPAPASKKKAIDLVRLNHHEVDYSAARALSTIRGTDGRLLRDRPSGVHPTIWRLEQEKERSKI